MEDDRIVELFLARDESAIRETANKYGSRLRKIANGILGKEQTAEECENDTYLEAWRRIPPSEPRSYLFAFLGRIIRHLAIDEVRREQAQKRQAQQCSLSAEMEECLPAAGRIEDGLEAEDLRRSISVFLKRCPEEQRRIFLKRYWYCESIEEISRSTGFHRGRIKSLLFRMRAALKKELEKEGYEI